MSVWKDDPDPFDRATWSVHFSNLSIFCFYGFYSEKIQKNEKNKEKSVKGKGSTFWIDCGCPRMAFWPQILARCCVWTGPSDNFGCDCEGQAKTTSQPPRNLSCEDLVHGILLGCSSSNLDLGIFTSKSFLDQLWRTKFVCSRLFFLLCSPEGRLIFCATWESGRLARPKLSSFLKLNCASF